MPLIIAPVQTELRIRKLALDEKTKRHLESLGLTVDAMIRILSKSNGNVILMIKEGRLALDNQIASKIFVA